MKRIALLGVTLLMTAFVMVANAATVTLYLDTEFSMAQSPQGPTPWLTATFDDTADAIGSTGVRLTLSTTNLVDSEFVSQWLFNFSGDASQLTFTPIDVAAANTINGTPAGMSDGYNGDGTGKYDILFDFQQAGGSGRFTGGETLVYDIGYSVVLSASDFDIFSTGGENGEFRSAALITSISDPVFCSYANPDWAGDPDCGSGWIGPTESPNTIPVPAAMWLFGSGLIGLIGFAGRRKTR